MPPPNPRQPIHGYRDNNGYPPRVGRSPNRGRRDANPLQPRFDSPARGPAGPNAGGNFNPPNANIPLGNNNQQQNPPNAQNNPNNPNPNNQNGLGGGNGGGGGAADNPERKAALVNGEGMMQGAAAYMARGERQNYRDEAAFSSQLLGNLEGADYDKLLNQMKTQGDGQVRGTMSADTSETILRPRFDMAGLEQLYQTAKKQRDSDVMFDMFDMVQPGFGEGAQNKLFLGQEYHRDAIQFGGHMSDLRRSDGQTDGPRPPPMQFQNGLTMGDIETYMQGLEGEAVEAELMMRQNPTSTALYQDLNMKPSSKGLLTNKPSPLLPVIDNMERMRHVRPAAGVHLQKRGLKSVYNTWNMPEQRESRLKMNVLPSNLALMVHDLGYRQY